VNQFWPEIDAYINLDERSHLFLMYSATRDFGDLARGSWTTL